MATIPFFILLTLILTLSSTIHARESQFFNKFSNQESQPLNTNQQQQPDFIPQSQDSTSSYGLYGQEPSTTNTNTNNKNNNNLPSYLPENYNPVAYTTPIHSTTQDIPEEYRDDPQPYHYNGQENTMYNSQEQEEFNDRNTYKYNSEKQGMSDTRFLENGKYYYNGYKSQKQGFDDASFMETEDNDNTYNSRKQVDYGRYNSQRQGYGTSNYGNVYNGEKQGMSDTRFLENGKYFYDLNMENANYNQNMNTRSGFNSRNEYNTQGYYGNNNGNGNSYDRYNTNYNGGGYQNQGDDGFSP